MLSGKRIGRYHIERKIGEGGMGEVYLASDTELERTVAVKILPTELAAKEDRMRRFVQEAKSAAALNHPNIAHIYEIGEQDGVNFIAMEFVDGLTLRQLMHDRPSDLTKMLRYLQHAAEGLAKAHSAGIVHRDIKPENLMVTREGHVKILDFGLAKLVGPQDLSDNTDSDAATAILKQHSTPGTILGTMGYMSPEQARGKIDEIDNRSDIFSFGCLLYEVLTGRKPFEGSDAIDTLNKIIREPAAPISTLNPDAPADLQRVVRRCLAKDPDERYQSMKDVAIEIKDVRREMHGRSEVETTVPPLASQISTQTSAPTEFTRSGASNTSLSSQAVSTQASSAEYVASQIGRHKILFLGGTLVLIALLLGGGYAIYRSARTEPPAPRAQIKISRLVTGLGDIGNASISPDGKYVAYQVTVGGKASLHLRQVSTGSDREIVPPVEDGAFRATVFSPDGELVYYNFYQAETSPEGTLYQIPVIGGREPRKILEHVTSMISFAPDGKRFTFTRDYTKTGDSAVLVTSIDGGEPVEIARRKGQDWFYGIPAWSPDGRVIVCPAGTDTGGTHFTLVEIPAAGGPERQFSPYKWHGEVFRPLWLKDGSGMVVNARESDESPMQIWKVTYPGGEVTRITNDLTQYGSTSFGLTSDSSTIMTIASQTSSQIWLVSPNEDESKARKLTSGSNDGESGLDWTPSGKVVYVAKTGDNADIWTVNDDGTGQRQLTSTEDSEATLRVSPDGRFIAFGANRPGVVNHIFLMDSEGRSVRQLTQGEFSDFQPIFSPDGAALVFVSWRTGSPRLWKMPANGGEPVQVTDVAFNAAYEGSGFLPDGKRIFGIYYDDQASPARQRSAILSMETGQIVKTFDLPAKAVHWRMMDDKTVVYTTPTAGADNLWSSPIDGGAAKQLTKFSSGTIFNFRQSRDGKRFAIARGTASADIILIKGFL